MGNKSGSYDLGSEQVFNCYTNINILKLFLFKCKILKYYYNVSIFLVGRKDARYKDANRV